MDKFTRAVGIDTFAMYVQDYGAPVGYRIASAQPERVRGIIVQNGNAYDEGLGEFWIPLKAYWKDQNAENTSALVNFLGVGATKWQWTHGVRDASVVSPDTWTIDRAGLDRPGNREVQLKLFLGYDTNPQRAGTSRPVEERDSSFSGGPMRDDKTKPRQFARLQRPITTMRGRSTVTRTPDRTCRAGGSQRGGV